MRSSILQALGKRKLDISPVTFPVSPATLNLFDNPEGSAPKSNPVGKEDTWMVDHLGTSVPCIVDCLKGQKYQNFQNKLFNKTKKNYKIQK